MPSAAEVFLFGGFRFDRRSGALARRDEHGVFAPLEIGSRALGILGTLLEQPGELVSRTEIIAAVWPGTIVEDANLGVQLTALRRVLDRGRTEGSCIQTVRGRGYRFMPPVTRVAAETAATPATGVAPRLPDKPSLAVLPFQNMSGDPQQEYFADGIVEEIITALSRVTWLFVIARNSSFTYKGQAVDVQRVGRELGVRYVLEGAVRKAGSRVRISAQLIDATTGMHLWAERFDGPLADIFELQDEVAASVAGVIEPAVQAAETTRSAHRPTHDLTAFDLYLRALHHFNRVDRSSLVRGLGMLEEAIERDPDYGPALALAAHCHQRFEVMGWTDDPAAARRTGAALARRALRNSPDDPEVLRIAAFVPGYFGEDIDVSLRLIDRCLVLNPSHAGGWYSDADCDGTRDPLSRPGAARVVPLRPAARGRRDRMTARSAWRTEKIPATIGGPARLAAARSAVEKLAPAIPTPDKARQGDRSDARLSRSRSGGCPGNRASERFAALEVTVPRFYPAIISKHEDTDYGVVFPDFPGCATTGETIREVAEMALEALALHVEGMVEDREALPEPSAPDAPLPDWLADLPDQTVARVLVPVELPGRAVRVNITLDEGLLARLDKAAGAEGETRSGYIAQAVRQRLAR